MAELRVKGTGTLKLFESDNTSSVTIASPASLGGDRTITLPDADVTLVSGTMSTGFAVADITGQTALGATPADTDEFVLSDAGVLKRVDYSYIKGATNTPNFMIKQGTATSLVTGTRTKVELNTAIFDTDSGLDAANDRWTVPAGKGGTYLITYSLRIQSATDFDGIQAMVYKNAAALYSVWGANVYYNSLAGSFLAVLAEADYLEMYGLQISGGAIDASTTDYGLQTYLGGVRLTT